MRKSEQIGLSAPYDWSNPNIGDEVLILRVLEGHRLEDVARVCARYGTEKVAAIAQGIREPYVGKVLQRMLKNIRRGFDDAANASQPGHRS